MPRTRRGLLQRGLSAAVMLGAFTAASLVADSAPASPPASELVILVHGMGRSRASMSLLQARFAARGYETHNFPYLTCNEDLDAIAGRLRRFIRQRARGRRYHLVAHSLGNVLIRRASRDGLPAGQGRIVMVTPPNHPPRLARLARDLPPYRWVTGDAGQRLADPGFYDALPAPTGEFGVIAGSRGQRLTFSEPNDGIVAVANTRLDGMADFILVPDTHSLILMRSRTFELALRFIKTGRFA